MTSTTNLSPEQEEALGRAIEALERSYCPYSTFAVGACLVMDDGTMVTGANVENAAHGPTICAERSAVVRANALGRRLFRGIAVTGRLRETPDQDADDLTPPCGVCRQVLFEMTDLGGHDRDPWVVLGSPSRRKVEVTSVRTLLPDAFGPSDLGIDLTSFRV
jgi:cytidine deaminase